MSKLRLIHCGTGGMGVAWRKNALGSTPDFDVAALVDIADAPLNDAGEALNVPPDRRFKSLQAALDAGVEADAVLTVTPPPVHVEHARLAFSRGLHLLTEKPLADTLDNAKLMVRLAREGRQRPRGENACVLLKARYVNGFCTVSTPPSRTMSAAPWRSSRTARFRAARDDPQAASTV